VCESSSCKDVGVAKAKSLNVRMNSVTSGLLSLLMINQKHIQYDPKDGELYVGMTKADESSLEVSKNSNVQIDSRTCVWGRKTNRTI
jgi:hypothetical protein